MAHDHETAARLLDKLRRLATEELDSEERVLLGVCLAPAVMAATESEDVAGFAFTPVGDEALGARLQAALQESNLRIVDFGAGRGKPDLRIGRVLDAAPAPEARRPGWTLTVDFGPVVGQVEAGVPLDAGETSSLPGRLVVGTIDHRHRGALLLSTRDETGATRLLEVPDHIAPGAPVTW